MTSLVGVLGQTASDHRAVEYVEDGEQDGGAVALVVMGHGPALARLQRQAWLGVVQRLDLALLVDETTAWAGGLMQRPTMSSTLMVKAEALDLLKGAEAIGLQPMGQPDVLDRAQRHADGLGNQPSGPVGDRPGRVDAGQGNDPGDQGGRQRRGAGLARVLSRNRPSAPSSAKRCCQRQTAGDDAGAACHFQYRQSVAGEQHDPGTLRGLVRAVAIAGDLFETEPVGRVQEDAHDLGRGLRFRCPPPLVNLLSASMH